ncbi:hypothetical protein [Candidatus Mesenet endosymbiont of Agriotes lineatus]|uniref:hypothetical protein n=1 Tax=Candidatus Mesenet endosymbiont of Agriotes lineatus TaxID=3077948 RepID=UPI0030D24F42
MSDHEYIEKIMFNKITPEQLRENIDNGQYEIKNLSYEEISEVDIAFNFMNLGHSLNIAIIGNDLEIIKLILEKRGKPLNQKDVREKHYFDLDSSTISFTHTLHAAIARLIPNQHYCNTDQERKKILKNINCKIIELLVKNGAEVVNDPKYSTLHYAVETKCTELIQLVIGCGAEYVEGKRRSIHSPKEKSTEELAEETQCKDIIELIFQQKEKIGSKCSKLIQSFIKNGTTYPLDKGRCTKNKVLNKCTVELISDHLIR